MRRVVTAVDKNGKSFVSSDEEIAEHGTIWTVDPKEFRAWVEAIDPSGVFQKAQPPVGGARWALAEIGPRTESLAVTPGRTTAGIDEKGFHVTKSIDLILVLAGTPILELDRDRVELKPGNLVVLQAGRHAWRNLGDETARFIDVLVSAI